MLTSDACPEIDLHRHLDGNIRPATILSLAKRQNSPLAKHDLASLEKLVYIDDKMSDLMTFLRNLDFGISVLQSPRDCYQIAYENIEDASNEGLTYVELRFSPFYMANTHQLNMRDVIAAVCDGIRDGVADFGIQTNLIGILSRTYGVEQCFAELEAILAFRQHFVAVDLAGDELNFPPGLFIEHFEKVKSVGLSATIHAGEAGGADNVWTAINKLHASRIGHGVKSIEDESLLHHLAEHKIGIESCLTSNYQTGTWTELSSHPLKTFLSYGIEACLCTDDPGVSNITLYSEHELAKNTLKLSNSELVRLKRNAAHQAFRN